MFYRITNALGLRVEIRKLYKPFKWVCLLHLFAAKGRPVSLCQIILSFEDYTSFHLRQHHNNKRYLHAY